MELWELRLDGSNFCRHVKRPKKENRERFLSDQQCQRLGTALREIEREGSETTFAIAGIRLPMLDCYLPLLISVFLDRGRTLGHEPARLRDTSCEGRFGELWSGEPIAANAKRLVAAQQRRQAEGARLGAMPTT